MRFFAILRFVQNGNYIIYMGEEGGYVRDTNTPKTILLFAVTTSEKRNPN